MRTWRKRRWLNRLGYHTTAFVYAFIDREAWVDENDGTHRIRYDGGLNIADCGRMVQLEFGMDRNSLRKLDILILTAQELRTALRKAAKDMADGI